MIIDVDQVMFKRANRYFKLKRVDKKDFGILATFFPQLNPEFYVPMFMEVDEEGKPLYPSTPFEHEIREEDLKTKDNKK
jgi:hypothetical protein